MIERKFVSLATGFKMTAEGSGTLEGYANDSNVLDDGGDIVTGYDGLDEFMSSGFTTQDHSWAYEGGVIGFPVDCKVDDRGLYSTMQFHSTPDAQAVRVKCQERMDAKKQVGLSIGYMASGQPTYIYPSDYASEIPKYVKSDTVPATLEKAKKFNKVRVLRVQPKEFSIVASPMNASSQATSVKGNQIEVKGAQGAPDLPLASRDAKWDKGEADKRVRDWAGAADKPNDKYRKCFLWYDSDNEDNYTGGKLLIVDIVDGKAVIVPKAVFAVAQRLDGTDIPDADKDKIKETVSGLYKKMAKEFDDPKLVAPWDAEKAIAAFQKKDAKGAFTDELNERNENPWNYVDVLLCLIYDMLWMAEYGQDLGGISDMSIDYLGKYDEIGAEFLARLKVWFAAALAKVQGCDIDADDDGDAEIIMLAGMLAPLNAKRTLADQGELAVKMLGIYLDRVKSLNKRRIEDGRKVGATFGAESRERMNGQIDKMTAAIDHITAARDDMKLMLDQSATRTPDNQEPSTETAAPEKALADQNLFASFLHTMHLTNQAFQRLESEA